MKSKANIKGHPLHPILVAFPIALYTITLIFDIIGWAGNARFHEVATYVEVAGIIGAACAAVPGLIDLLYTVPPKSTGKKRGVRHGLTNTVALLCFGGALVYRLNAETPSSLTIVAIEAAGLVLTLIAGWMGGTLVYRNQIGVDIRYAHAGKWQESHAVENNGTFQLTDPHLQLNQMRLVHAAGQRIVIAMTEHGYVAFGDHCTHRGGSLAGGSLICGTVQCPWHGSQFDVKAGTVNAGPARESIETYPVALSGNTLSITLRPLPQAHTGSYRATQ